jgi:hypothetical protein
LREEFLAKINEKQSKEKDREIKEAEKEKQRLEQILKDEFKDRLGFT